MVHHEQLNTIYKHNMRKYRLKLLYTAAFTWCCWAKNSSFVRGIMKGEEGEGLNYRDLYWKFWWGTSFMFSVHYKCYTVRSFHTPHSWNVCSDSWAEHTNKHTNTQRHTQTQKHSRSREKDSQPSKTASVKLRGEFAPLTGTDTRSSDFDSVLNTQEIGNASPNFFCSFKVPKPCLGKNWF